MSIGPDIKEVYAEVGLQVEVQLQDESVVSTEYVDIELNSQVTKPFIREYFLEAFFPYDTAVQAGYLVKILQDGRIGLVMNKTPETFENTSIQYSTILYRTNVVVTTQRLTDGAPAHETNNYTRERTFTDVNTGINALLVSSFVGSETETEDFGVVDKKALDLFISSLLDVQEQDRIVIPATSEIYRVDTVERRLYPGAHFCRLSEDVR